MEKIKYLECIVDENEYDEVEGVEVFDEGKRIFSVYNLNECPEDAIIGRDLFDDNDFIEAVRYGIELAKQGYTEVKYK